MGKTANTNKTKKSKSLMKQNKSKSSNKNSDSNTIDYINSGIRIFEQIGSLAQSIIEEKNKTERARIETERLKVESNERIENLEIKLKEDVARIHKELEVYREDIKVKLKNIDKEIEESKMNYETQQLKLRLNHEVRMKLIEEQGAILERVLDIYSRYYDSILTGNEVPISPDYIFRDMQNCIDTLKHSISTMSGQNNIIDVNYIEE